MLLFEHGHRPIEGELLTISRNAIGLTPAQAAALLERAGTARRPGAGFEVDATTVHGYGATGWVSDRSFYAAFSPARLTVLDVIDYERPDIVHDMTRPIDPSLEGRFDFVINGSCLDNLFDPVMALKNTARMLRPGGRLFQFEACNSLPAAYLKYSPDWFHDYFAVNEFADCKVYVVQSREVRFSDSLTNLAAGGPGDVYLYDPLGADGGPGDCRGSDITSLRPQQLILVAEKGPHSTWDRNPVQARRRRDVWQRKTCRESALRFRASGRPIFSTGHPVPAEATPFCAAGTLRLVTCWPGAPVTDAAPGKAGKGLWGAARSALTAIRNILKRSA
jgi:SAM-dependent methyltransferase